MPEFNIEWDQEKSDALHRDHGVSFADLEPLIRAGILLGERPHHNQARYPNQRIFVVPFRGYAYIVPYVPNANGAFLKTLYPSRKATRDYLK